MRVVHGGNSISLANIIGGVKALETQSMFSGGRHLYSKTINGGHQQIRDWTKSTNKFLEKMGWYPPAYSGLLHMATYSSGH